MSINVGFDIDHTLTIPSVKDIDQCKFFSQKGALLSSKNLKTYYLYPGVHELIHLISKIDRVNLFFFSKGLEPRNRRFVRALLNRANVSDECRGNVRIFSREDVTNKKKDLSLVCEHDPIENAILFDDCYGNAVLSQEKNFLQVPYVDWPDYDKLRDKIEHYGELPVRYLKCEIKFVESNDDKVRESKRIFIYKNENDFEVKFINPEGVIQVEKVTSYEHSQLFADLHNNYAIGLTTGENGCLITNTKTIHEICKFVFSHKGRIRKICRKANHIAYITGLFFHSLDYAKKEQISLSEALYHNQYKNDRPDYGNERFYLLGMMRLKEVNPNFGLITPSNYMQALKAPIDQWVQDELEKAMSRKHFVKEEKAQTEAAFIISPEEAEVLLVADMPEENFYL